MCVVCDGGHRMARDAWEPVIHADYVRPFNHNDLSTCCIEYIGYTRATVRHRAFHAEPTIVGVRQPGIGDVADRTPNGRWAADSKIVLSAQLRSVAESGTRGAVRVIV